MASKKEVVWPPQTMEDVLNLTPRKRKVSDASVSPSPNPAGARYPSALEGDDSDPEDEDEEILKLKLAQIEAKLKLKQLQKKKLASSGDASQGAVGGSRDFKENRTAGNASSGKNLNAAKPIVQVPLSPSAAKRAPPPPVPQSPSRITLGIDKGLKGRDISLRRPPSRPVCQGQPSRASVTAKPTSPPRPQKSFNQRIAEERAKEKAKLGRQLALERTRSREFESFQSVSADDSVSLPPRPPTASFSSLVTRIEQRAHSLSLASQDNPIHSPATSQPLSFSDPVSQSTSEEQSSFESFSGFHLSRRQIPHITLSRHLSPKTVFLLPQLLKTVVAPDFEAPDVDGDWVVLGIICSKSEPRDVGQNTARQPKDGSKYMVMQLTDLKWEVELFLFGGGFEKFWKIGVGTVVAILNPRIMKPRKAETGKFSLTLTESSDSLLEVGLSRDLGCCKAVKRDGKQCGSWVDMRHTHYCAFHVEQGVKKSRVGRAEVNSMSMLFSPPKKGTSRPRSLSNRRPGAQGPDDGLLREGPIMDLPQRIGGAGGEVFVAPGRSTAALLDDDDYLADDFHRGTKEDRLRKRLADAEKERQLTRNLIRAQGREGGIGVAYLKKHSNHDESDRNLHSRDGWDRPISRGNGPRLGQRNDSQMREDLTSLRSRVTDASSIKLSPIKRKRVDPPVSILKRQQPVAKKTRFLTGKGIVEAGAQSGDVSLDEDDDLLIVKE